MMKWKARTETNNVGILELDNFIFNEDCMAVSIDICDMSDNLKAEVAKAIEARKLESDKEWEQLCLEHPDYKRINRTFSGNGEVIDFTYLDIILKEDEPIQYSIVVGFHDADNECLEREAEIAVDLSEHAEELKKMIIKALIDKFF